VCALKAADHGRLILRTELPPPRDQPHRKTTIGMNG
jgi:hypothetical protein